MYQQQTKMMVLEGRVIGQVELKEPKSAIKAEDEVANNEQTAGQQSVEAPDPTAPVAKTKIATVVLV